MLVENLFPPTIDGTVYLEVTHRCNFSCKHCYARCPAPREMSFDKVKEAVLILKDSGFKKIVVTGGEPLLHPNIKEIIAFIKAQGLKIVLITNGSLVKSSGLDFSLIDGVYISFDGPTEVEYKALRGREGLKKAEEAIQYLKGLGVDVAVGVILSKININKVDQLIKKIKELNIEKVTVTVPQPFGRTLDNKDIMLDPDEYSRVIPKLAKAGSIHFESMLCYPVELSNDCVKDAPLIEKYLSGCAAGKKFIYVSPEGFVIPCGYATADKEFIQKAGNLFKQSMPEIYNTPLFKFHMNRSWESVKGKCTKCNYNVICKGGCPLRSYYMKGNPQLPDPWCRNDPVNNQYIKGDVKTKNFIKIENVTC